jgi:hypothetical protein
MSLAAVSAMAGARLGCRLAALVLLVAATSPAPPARADAAADFSATVKVDATADTADKARDLARLDGQRRALEAVVTRLSGATDAAAVVRLDDNAITNMVVSLDVADERMSAVHYEADYTFHFQPAKVRTLLHAAAAHPASPMGSPVAVQPLPPPPAGAPLPAPPPTSAAGNAGKPVVVLPVLQQGGHAMLWEDPNPWREAWLQLPPATGPVNLTIPLGDAGDLATIDAPAALSGRAAALTAIAGHNGGNETIVALATAQQQDGRLAGLDVAVKEYLFGQLSDSRDSSFAARPGETEGALLARAAAAVAAQIESGAGQPVAPAVATQGGAAGGGPPATLTAVVPLGTLDDWIEVRRRLASLATVRRVELLSLTRREAKIEIHYLGNPDSLKLSLAGANLELAGGKPLWQLRRSSAASMR